MKWYSEKLYGSWHARYSVRRTLLSRKTPFQHLRIIESPTWGRMLTLDEITQTTEKDEFIYHEMMTHVPLVMHGNCKRVLIIGGGDGGILREVLKHPVERAVMVEIDDEVVRACKKHMPSLSAGAFDDPRAELIYGDGAKFVRETKERFDAVLIDSPDPVGPAKVLFEPRFYHNVYDILTVRGIVSRQSGVPMLQPEVIRTCVHGMRRVFPRVTAYLATIPTYVGGEFSFTLGTKAAGVSALNRLRLRDRVRKLKMRTRYYNEEIHEACFALPNYVKECLE